MAETTGIAYVHHTRNFWSGCTKIGPGCDGCYAEAFNRWTRGKNEETGQAKNWGPGAPRIPHLEGAAKDLRKWNAQALAAGERRRVFVNTNSDTFDNEVPQAWRTFMWPVLEECVALDILLVTKRIGNVASMVPARWIVDGFPAHIRLLITVVNQLEANRDVPKVLALPCKNGISNEPALGPVDWGRLDFGNRVYLDALTGLHFGEAGPAPINEALAALPVPLPKAYPRGVEWMIPGGESNQAGHKARACHLAWVDWTIAQCRDARVPCFFKQAGSHPVLDGVRLQLRNDTGADLSELPPEFHVQEVPT